MGLMCSSPSCQRLADLCPLGILDFSSWQLLQPVGLLASDLLLLQVSDEEDDEVLASRYISPGEALGRASPGKAGREWGCNVSSPFPL